ncbi:hypothetical protein ADL12_39895 [Streptomyces regalis]|uniref:Isoprenyl transferase n=2 Tax=Streptomyces regalis TaxID=68262 RepID=A0A117ML23_9ACTN|nr:hypothetical protein ADL12_39895 [Streptomyces regalis]
MRIGTGAAFVFPNSLGTDLDLASDLLAFHGIVNDQVHSASEQRAAHAAAICNDLLALLQHDSPAEPATPYGAAWCDLWLRLADGMPTEWQDRARHHHSQLFSAYLAPRIILTQAQYLDRRFITSGLAVWLDVAERTSHFELPEPVRASALIRDLCDEAVKLLILPHDVFSVEREEARGEVDNMVLVMEHATGKPRAQVITEIQAMVRDAGKRFLLLESRIPELGTTLALGPSDLAAMDSYVKAMRDCVRGLYDWQKGTARYDLQAAGDAIASGYEDAPLLRTASTSPSPAIRRPRHLAIIPDGNRRWARNNGVPLAEGFRRGTDNFAALLGWCDEASIEVVSLWMSSPDNLAKRPTDEVAVALRYTADVVRQLAHSRHFRLRPIGNLTLLPADFAALLHDAAEATAGVHGMTVNLAAAYSGTQDLIDAMRACLPEGAAALTHERIEAHLSTHGQPPVDLLIRTSGEQRLSGFMPWQTADTELYFTDTPWPDFTREDLHLALSEYGKREQRHGA